MYFDCSAEVKDQVPLDGKFEREKYFVTSFLLDFVTLQDEITLDNCQL